MDVERAGFNPGLTASSLALDCCAAQKNSPRGQIWSSFDIKGTQLRYIFVSLDYMNRTCANMGKETEVCFYYLLVLGFLLKHKSWPSITISVNDNE